MLAEWADRTLPAWTFWPRRTCPQEQGQRLRDMGTKCVCEEPSWRKAGHPHS